MRTLVCTPEGIFIWPGAALVERRRGTFVRASERDICDLAGPDVCKLGLEPGAPFPPMAVFVIFAPGPGHPYDYVPLPPPKFEKGILATRAIIQL
jgi:hypothetical protein